MATAADLASANYNGGAGFSKGITAADYDGGLYSPHGKAFEWWKAYDAPEGVPGRTAQGRVYIEQTLDTAARVLVYQTKRAFEDAEFGAFEIGSSAMSSLPKYAEFARMDRIALPDVTFLRRQVVKRGSTDTDALFNVPVASIEKVFAEDGTVYARNLYRVATGNVGIKWVSGAPTLGDFYYLETRQTAVYEYLMDEQGAVQRGPDDSKLPQRGLVRLLLPGEQL